VVVDAPGVLALEWLDFAPPDAGFGERLGRALGAQHRAAAPMPGYGYGWHCDNFIGATPQANARRADWVAFYGELRLAAMRDKLTQRGEDAALLRAVDEVIAALPRFFDDGHQPRPSLVHGDLWSGNWSMLADGTPVIYDPAVSCSDAEAELAMMELFGAPPAGFWPAYREAAGLHAGYAARRPLYQLYHLLNHALLFGGGYAAQALRCARSLL
jgi:fructosamine-3-kinase